MGSTVHLAGSSRSHPAGGLVLAVALAACHGGGPVRSAIDLRAACADHQYWDGTACKPRGDADKLLAQGRAALDEANVDGATAALDAAAKAGPLEHAENISLWEQRGIAASYVEDDAKARSAFTMLLALDPGHFLSYQLSTKATFRFEAVRNANAKASPPAVDVAWAFGQRVGKPVAVDVSVLADPLGFMKRATLFVRARGEPTWRAADVPLGADGHLWLPAVRADKPVSLELYLKAYDAAGNEVLTWARPDRPREIPLRYDPPRPWWQKWWVITIAGAVVVGGTSAIVYAVTREPPSMVDGGGVVH